MGSIHLMNCKYIDDIKVEAVADSSKTALKRASVLGIKNQFTDYHELFKKSLDLDAVIISLPNFLHFDSMKLAVESGINVFVEKPLAKNVAEGKEIVDLARRNNSKVMVGHQLRFYTPIEKIKQAIDEGRLGRTEVVTIEEVTNGPFTHPAVPKPVAEWWFDADKVGGGSPT